MNRKCSENIAALLEGRRSVFSLRKVSRNIIDNSSQGSEEIFPSNPVELVLQVNGRIDRMLNEIGIPKSRGIGERLALLGCSCPVQNSIKFLVDARNRIVHCGQTNETKLQWFSPTGFINDYCTIKKYLKWIGEIMKREGFQREYLANTKGKISAIEYAEKRYRQEIQLKQ